LQEKDKDEKGLYEYNDEQGHARIGYYTRRIIGKKRVAVVDLWPDEDNDDYVDGVPDRRRNCPHCAQFQLVMKLGPKRTPKDQEIPYDNDKWLECYHCGNIFPKHEIERQKKLKTDIAQHKAETPFEVGETIITSVPSRTSPAGRKAAAKRKRERQRAHHKDPEIDRAIQQFGENNVHIIQDE
jgi:hypothetical protein